MQRDVGLRSATDGEFPFGAGVCVGRALGAPACAWGAGVCARCRSLVAVPSGQAVAERPATQGPPSLGGPVAAGEREENPEEGS